MNNFYFKINQDGTLVYVYGTSKDLIIPETVKKLGYKCFVGCENLTSIIIPDSVYGIGREAFHGCTSLKSIVIPNSVQSIQEKAFDGCSSLTDIVIPDSVKDIGREAFGGCSELGNITVDKDNKKYDSRDNCNAIIETESNTLILGCASTVIPNSVTGIGDSAFDSCIGLTSLVVPNSIEEIGWGAFRGCTGLLNIVISKADTINWGETFKCCPSRASIIVNKDNKKYDSRDNCNAIIETESNTLILGCASTVIPNSVTGIGDSAFYGCIGLTSLVIPENVTRINELAFYGCTNLTNLVIPDSIEEIGWDAFRGCTSLHVSIPEKITNWLFEDVEDDERYYRYYNLFTGCKSVSRYLSLNDKKEYQSFVTPEELENGIITEYNVRYSKDGKRLLSDRDPDEGPNLHINGNEAFSYRIRKGTEIICDDASLGYCGALETVHVPASAIYIGMYALDCNNLILEGINTFFCNKFWRPDSTGVLYVPNNSKLNYISRLGERIDKSYISADKSLRIVELSKSNVINCLEYQRKLITDIIANPEPMKEYTIDSLDGRGALNFLCIRTDNVCFFGRKETFKPYFLTALYALGMPLKESCLKVGINVEQLQVNQSTKNSLVGRTLVQSVYRIWEEDFVDEDTGEVVVDEDTGEVVRIQRYDRIVDHRLIQCLEETDIDVLIENNISSVLVYGKDTPSEEILDNVPPYLYFIEYLNINPSVKKYVLKHFLIVDVDESERLTLANELADIYKAFVGAKDCVDGANPVQQPHDEVSPEEKDLIDHISEFYKMKINAIINCETDLDMMPLFTTVRETYHELIAFLEENKVSDRISMPYVSQLFKQLCEFNLRVFNTLLIY